jgi:hypothetical protein
MALSRTGPDPGRRNPQSQMNNTVINN